MPHASSFCWGVLLQFTAQAGPAAGVFAAPVAGDGVGAACGVGVVGAAVDFFSVVEPGGVIWLSLAAEAGSARAERRPSPANVPRATSDRNQRFIAMPL
jgi:hypothetical protein